VIKIEAEEAHKFRCPLNKFEDCQANDCMFWVVDSDDEEHDGCAINLIAKRLK